VLGEIGMLAARTGDRATALSIVAHLPDTGHTGCERGGEFLRARVFAALDRPREAVQSLKKVMGQSVFGCVSALWMIHQDPEFIPLRGYAPFDSILRADRLAGSRELTPAR
jgi:hypothetical protein